MATSIRLGAGPPGWTAGVGRIGAIVGLIITGAMLAGDRGYPWVSTFRGPPVLMMLLVGHPRDVVDEEVAEHEAVVAH